MAVVDEVEPTEVAVDSMSAPVAVVDGADGETALERVAAVEVDGEVEADPSPPGTGVPPYPNEIGPKFTFGVDESSRSLNAVAMAAKVPPNTTRTKRRLSEGVSE